MIRTYTAHLPGLLPVYTTTGRKGQSAFAILAPSEQGVTTAPYRPTDEERSRLLRLYARPAFGGLRALAVSFESDPAILRALLPPPLEPATRPLVRIDIHHVARPNCLGPFFGAGVNIACQYQGQQGNFCLAMPMSTEAAVLFGRELYGEPKKLARISLERRGREASGVVERHGITYIELRATLTEEAPPPATAEWLQFYFKYLPSPDGRGFDLGPELVQVRHTGPVRRLERGRGEVILRESPHDPVAALPVRKVLGAAWSEGDTYTEGQVLCQVDPEAFLPYMFFKSDDWGLLAAEAQAGDSH
ncbi:MAG: acetoacetate decarboxylase family protein [Chloroflexi bacterium]|nr:acetoacetate decarboxylase family protein [Chloroflexota bacterium]